MAIKQESEERKAIRESEIFKDSLSASEKKVFNKIKRALMRTFVNPNYSVKMLIDLAALEYIRYAQILTHGDEGSTGAAKSIKDILGELDLTPKSKKTEKVSATLSQIFKTVTENSAKET